MKPTKADLKNPDFLTKLSMDEGFKKNKKKLKYVFIATGIFQILWVLGALASSPVFALVLACLFVCADWMIIYFIRLSMKRSRYQTYALSVAAWQGQQTFIADPLKPGPFDVYQTSTGLAPAPTVIGEDLGSYGNVGSDIKNLKIISGQDYSIYERQYTTGSGKSRQVNYMIFSVRTLSRNLPHMMLDNIGNNAKIFGKNFSFLPTSYDSEQKVDAGILSQHFNVYVPDSYDVDVLSIISPEVIEALIQFSGISDIEIIDNKLIIYNHGKLTPESYSKAYSQLYQIAKEFEDNLRSYRDERATTVNSRTAIGKEGLRLQGNIYARVLGLLGAVLFGGISIASEAESVHVALFTLGAVAIATPPSLIYAKIATTKQRQKRKDAQRQQMLNRTLDK